MYFHARIIITGGIGGPGSRSVQLLRKDGTTCTLPSLPSGRAQHTQSGLMACAGHAGSGRALARAYNRQAPSPSQTASGWPPTYSRGHGGAMSAGPTTLVFLVMLSLILFLLVFFLWADDTAMNCQHNCCHLHRPQHHHRLHWHMNYSKGYYFIFFQYYY